MKRELGKGIKVNIMEKSWVRCRITVIDIQLFFNFQTIQAQAPTPVAEPVINEPLQGATPTNASNLFAIGRRPASATEEPTIFMTRSEVETMLTREKEKPLVCSILINLKPPYAAEIAAKPYSMGYTAPQF